SVEPLCDPASPGTASPLHCAAGRIPGHEAGAHGRQRGHFFPDLLAGAQWQDQRAPGFSRGTVVRDSMGADEVRLHRAAAAHEFSGDIWSLRGLGGADFLGIFLWPAASFGRIRVGGRTYVKKRGTAILTFRFPPLHWRAV